MKRKYFITGTGSGVGKTFVSVALLNAFSGKGFTTLGLKPIATDSVSTDNESRSDDAVELTKASSVRVAYQQTNPVLLHSNTTPSLAAMHEDKKLTANNVVGYIRGTLMTSSSEVTLIEGVDGWRVPLNFRETYADVVKQLNIDVIIVVDVKPSCLSHALLTLEAIQQDGVNVVGWIANSTEPNVEDFKLTTEVLCAHMRVPLIALMPFIEDSGAVKDNWVDPRFLSDPS